MMQRTTLMIGAALVSVSFAACSQDAGQSGEATVSNVADATEKVMDKAAETVQAVGENLKAGGTVKLSTDEEKEGYAMGMALGQQIKAQIDRVPVDFDRDALIRALSDAVHGREMAMDQEVMAAALTAQRDKIVAIEEEKASNAKAEGEKFLAEFAAQDGAQKTESGILYQVLTAGDGAQPTAESTVKVHYRGTLKDGTEFDSSYKREQPAEFPVGGVIKGWQEILPMMKAGGKWKVAIPSDLAYGERGAGGNIGPNEPLVFEIELLEIK